MTMIKLIALNAGGLHSRVAARPVSLQEYRSYLRATGQPIPLVLSRATDTNGPVTYASQVEGLEYCRWLGTQDALRYRLPTVAELLALMGEAGLQGTSQDMWPRSHSQRPEVQGQRGALYLCEWTCETEALPQVSGGEPRVLGSVFYPPWLRHGNNSSQIQAMMLASQGSSFISFRVACD